MQHDNEDDNRRRPAYWTKIATDAAVALLVVGLIILAAL